MEMVLKKQSKWIDFIYENNLSDLLLGENFRVNYIGDKEQMQFFIDCSCNISEQQQSNNKLDAQEFIDTYSDKLVLLKLTDKPLSDSLSNFKAGKIIKECELVILFDKEYIYKARIDDNGNGKILINIC
jgi:hypothetical protein